MPSVAPHACAQPGCAHLVPRGQAHCAQHQHCSAPGCKNPLVPHSSYCIEHQPERKPDLRPPADERGYDARWHKQRDNFIHRNPVCFQCNAPGQMVHHLIPLAMGGGNEDSNLITLCNACHTVIEKQGKNNKEDKQ